MSRKIDLSNPESLSEDDLIYARDRGLLPPEVIEEFTGDDGQWEDEDDDDGSYESMSVSDLKELLEERDLPVSGNKGELIERLTEDDEKGEG